MNLVAELRRRNVIRAAGLYLVGAWLPVQVAATILPLFGAADRVSPGGAWLAQPQQQPGHVYGMHQRICAGHGAMALAQYTSFDPRGTIRSSHTINQAPLARCKAGKCTGCDPRGSGFR